MRAIAVAEAGDRGAAGAVDDSRAVGEMEVDAVTAGGDGWCTAGAMQDTTVHGRYLTVRAVISQSFDARTAV